MPESKREGGRERERKGVRKAQRERGGKMGGKIISVIRSFLARSQSSQRINLSLAPPESHKFA